MNSIKSFIYLDNYKMYSISSQLFEGLTEYIVKSDETKNESQEEQKGPLFSGKILAEIASSTANQTEKKFLHDYSYNLFEKKLTDSGKVLEVAYDNIKDSISKLSEFNFIKVRGKIIFNDAKILEETYKSFNDVGYAIGYVTSNNNITEFKQKVNKVANQIKDRNSKAKIQSIASSGDTEFRKSLSERGLYLNPDYLKNVLFLINYYYNQQLELQLPLDINGSQALFSSVLNRDLLKENEQNIIKKYSRETEIEFTIFGMITQYLRSEKKEGLRKISEVDVDGNEKAPSLKEAVSKMTTAINSIEEVFFGKLEYEVMIDPIAVYREV